MSINKLPRLPTLAELEARVEKELGKESKIEVQRQKIIEINCPILERHLVEYNHRGTARVRILDDRVVCEKYIIGQYFVFEGRNYNGCCKLTHRDKYKKGFGGRLKLVELEFDDCAYKNLHNGKEICGENNDL